VAPVAVAPRAAIATRPAVAMIVSEYAIERSDNYDGVDTFRDEPSYESRRGAYYPRRYDRYTGRSYGGDYYPGSYGNYGIGRVNGYYGRRGSQSRYGGGRGRVFDRYLYRSRGYDDYDDVGSYRRYDSYGYGGRRGYRNRDYYYNDDNHFDDYRRGSRNLSGSSMYDSRFDGDRFNGDRYYNDRYTSRYRRGSYDRDDYYDRGYGRSRYNSRGRDYDDCYD